MSRQSIKQLSPTPNVVAADITANPAVTSIAILSALALALSPYVLIIGGIVLVFSATSLPGPLKRLLPAPVVEVIALLIDFGPLPLPGSSRLEVLPNFFLGIAKDWLVVLLMLLLLL